MTDLASITNQLLPYGRVIVICGRTDDAQAWQDLLGSDRCLALALNDAPPEASTRPIRGASDQLAWQHDTIAGLDGSGWLAALADAFDPDQSATLVLPDPLDPPHAGGRKRIGARQPAWRIFEDKTAVDALWNAAGVSRAPSIVTDAPATVAELGALVDQGAGVVCSYQPIGAGPTAGGDGIWWWRGGRPPTTMPTGGTRTWRIRLMPLLEGTPVRLHGMILPSTVIPFPPMELVTLRRPDHGTFLCAGAVATLGRDAGLLARTEHVAARLHTLGYRGGFSVDGVVTTAGFHPTDFNGRLTSAIEATPPELRVQLHTVNLLSREGIAVEPAMIAELAAETFDNAEVYTLYGAAKRIRDGAPREIRVCWCGNRLVPAIGAHEDGHLGIARSPRGWLLTARLVADRLPTSGVLGPFAPEVFQLSDRVFGTDFGELGLPFTASRKPGALPV